MLKDNSIKNLLLISGSGRNCGKTTLACEIIKNVSKTMNVYALKISPHFHQLGKEQELLFQQEGFSIFKEKDMYSGKDSSRLLRAGAKESLYVQCEDDILSEAFISVMRFIPEGCPVVCESGALAKSYNPGLFLLLEGESRGQNKKSFLDNKRLADQLVHFDGHHFSVNMHQVTFNGKAWKLVETNQK